MGFRLEKQAGCMLSLRQIRFGYKQTNTLTAEFLDIQSASLTVVLGLNGSGKSTLLKVLAGIHLPFSGAISWNNISLGELSSTDRAKGIGWYTSAMNAMFRFLVVDVIRLGRYPHGGFLPKDQPHLDEILEMFQLQNLRDKSFDQLSAGQQQRVLLAKLWMQDPDIMLLDEPFDHLDIPHQYMLKQSIMGQKARGKAVVIVSHRLEDCWDYADHVITVSNGVVCAEGSPATELKDKILKEVFGVSQTQPVL